VAALTIRSEYAVIGAGDSVRARLLTGVNASTDGVTYPVMFKLIGDVQGPDGSSLPLGEARITGAVQASMVDSRALFRIHRINMRFPNGRKRVIPVDGWIIGEDGINGMQGILIDPMNKIIEGEVLTGTIRGLGEGLG